MPDRILAMIPARIGSTRLPKKNLALLSGEPLISYAINAAKDSGIFDRILLNSDSTVFKEIAQRYGVEFYHRPIDLGTSEAKSDSVVNDFMLKHPGDILVWVNPTSPLQPPDEIREVVDYFLDNELDSLITVKNENVHCLLDGKPLNFDPEGLFARTQDLRPVQPFVYSIMMWRFEPFLRTFREKGHALLNGKLGFYSVGKLSSIIIKTEEDLRLAEYVLTGKRTLGHYDIQYDQIICND